jgi:hypothetical protein
MAEAPPGRGLERCFACEAVVSKEPRDPDAILVGALCRQSCRFTFSCAA